MNPRIKAALTSHLIASLAMVIVAKSVGFCIWGWSTAFGLQILVSLLLAPILPPVVLAMALIECQKWLTGRLWDHSVLEIFLAAFPTYCIVFVITWFRQRDRSRRARRPATTG